MPTTYAPPGMGYRPPVNQGYRKHIVAPGSPMQPAVQPPKPQIAPQQPIAQYLGGAGQSRAQQVWAVANPGMPYPGSQPQTPTQPNARAQAAWAVANPGMPMPGAPQFANPSDRVAAVTAVMNGGAYNPQAQMQPKLDALGGFGGGQQFDRQAFMAMTPAQRLQQSQQFAQNAYNDYIAKGGDPNAYYDMGDINQFALGGTGGSGQIKGTMEYRDNPFSFGGGAQNQFGWPFGGSQQFIGAPEGAGSQASASPEQRWAGQQGALPHFGNMTGYENKFNLANYLTGQRPGSQDFASQMPNPANLYNGITGQAQNFLGGLPGSMGQNPFMGQGNDLLRYGMNMLGGGGAPQGPQLQGAPTQYNMPQGPQFQAPRFDNLNFSQFDPNSVRDPRVAMRQFDPNSVGGPNVPQITPANAQFVGPQLNAPTSGPNAGVPGFSDILSQARNFGGGIGNVPRENLQGSNFENDPRFRQLGGLSTQGIQSGLSSAQSLAQGGGFGIDSAALDAAAKRQYELAAQAGADKAIGRGFSPSGGSIGGREIGQAVADEAGRQAIARQQLLLDAASRRQAGQIAGTQALQGIGGTAGGLAGDQASRLLNENQFLGGSGIQQRGQDINLAQLGQQGQQSNLNALTNLAGTLGGLNINSFEAGTGRAGTLGNLGLGVFNAGTNRGGQMGDLDLRAQQLAQQGALGGYEAQTGRMTGLGQLFNQGQNNQQQAMLDAYNAATNRMGTQGNIYNQGVGNQIDAYGAATQRGQVGANALNDYNQNALGWGNLGLGYNELGSQNQNQFNNQMLNLYGQQSQNWLGGQQNQNDLLGTLLGGASDFSGQYSGNQMDLANLYANMLGQQGGFQQGYNQQQIGANQFDQGNFWNLYGQLANMGQQAQAQREANRFNFGRDVLGGLLGGAGQVAASY